MEVFGWKTRSLITGILALVFALVAFDIRSDWGTGASVSHLFSEAVIGFLALAGIGVLWVRTLLLSRKVLSLGQDLDSARADAKRWKIENAHLVQGLGESIQKQLLAWALTPAEREIALLLIKGLSLKEIASVRSTSERTVRQQTIALYSKSGLSGRAELAAYFLEDLLQPGAISQDTAAK